MIVNEKIKYWKELSEYDLDTASAMFKTARYLYVGFMCHQVIEKILKAYFVKSQNTTPPFSHSLSLLAKKAGLYSELTEIQKDFIDQIEPLNIEARYPSQKERLLKSFNKKKCSQILRTTRELHECLIKKL